MEFDPTSEYSQYINPSNLIRRDLIEKLKTQNPILNLHDAAGIIDMITQTGLIEVDTYFVSEGQKVVRGMKANYIFPINTAHKEVNKNLIIPELANEYKWKLTQKGKIISNQAIKSPYLEVEEVMSNARMNFGEFYAKKITDLIEKIEFYENMKPSDDIPKSFIDNCLSLLNAELFSLGGLLESTKEINLAEQRARLNNQLGNQ